MRIKRGLEKDNNGQKSVILKAQDIGKKGAIASFCNDMFETCSAVECSTVQYRKPE